MAERVDLLGLNEDEKLVYQFLEMKGDSSLKRLIDDTGLSEERVQRALGRLRENGTVLSHGETPRVFAVRFRDPEPGAEKGNMYYI